MERMWSKRLCHSFIQQTFVEPWWGARFVLNSGDKDESGTAPPSESLYSTSTPIRWLCKSMSLSSGLRAGQVSCCGKGMMSNAVWLQVVVAGQSSVFERRCPGSLLTVGG